jgi:hypothetical protein
VGAAISGAPATRSGRTTQQSAGARGAHLHSVPAWFLRCMFQAATVELNVSTSGIPNSSLRISLASALRHVPPATASAIASPGSAESEPSAW